MYIQYISNKYKVLGQNFERPVKTIGIKDSFCSPLLLQRANMQTKIYVYVYTYIHIYLYTYVSYFRNSMCTEKRRLSIVLSARIFPFRYSFQISRFASISSCNVKSTHFFLLMFERMFFFFFFLSFSLRTSCSYELISRYDFHASQKHGTPRMLR